MQIKLGVEGRKDLETNRVRCHRCKVVIPHKPEYVLTLLKPRMLGHRLLAVFLLLGVAHGVPGLCEAHAEKEDVSSLELDVTFACDG